MLRRPLEGRKFHLHSTQLKFPSGASPLQHPYQGILSIFPGLINSIAFEKPIVHMFFVFFPVIFLWLGC